MAQPPPSGSEVIGHYALRRKLGEGAMGEVWLARDKALDRDLAIKLLKVGGGPDAQRRIRDFVHEARATAKLEHPNIVTIHDVGSVRHRVYIAMEFVAGGSLADALQKTGALPWREATQAVRDAASALEAAHAAGIIHRDIKPANLMRGKRGVVKVVDFGLAKGGGDAEATMTAAGAILGSPAYMSPEQCRGETADARSDLYSLICTYYHLLTRQLPFSGETLTAVAYQHCHEPFPDIGDKAEGLPDAARRILARGSQKDRARRYQTAAQLVADLDTLLGTPEVSHTFDGAGSARAPRAPGFGAILKGKGAAGKTLWAVVALVIVAIGAIPLWRRMMFPGNVSPADVSAVTPAAPTPAGQSPAPPTAPHVTPRLSPSALVLPRDPGLFRTLKGHAQNIAGLQFSGDSLHILSWAADEKGAKTRLWNLVAENFREFDGNVPALSEDGRWLSVGGHYYHTDTGAVVAHLSELSAGPGDRGASRQVLFRASRTPRALFDADGKAVVSFPTNGPLRFSDDGRYCIVQRVDATCIYQTQTREQVAESDASTKGPCTPIALSADGQLAVIQEGKVDRFTLTLWNWRAGKRVALVDRQNGLYAEFSRDGRRVLTTAAWPINSVILWDAADPSSPRKIWEQDPSGPLLDAQLSSDGERILFASGNDLILLDAKTGSEMIRLHSARDNYLEHVIMSPDGRLAASAWHNETEIDVWRLPDP